MQTFLPVENDELRCLKHGLAQMSASCEMLKQEIILKDIRIRTLESEMANLLAGQRQIHLNNGR